MSRNRPCVSQFVVLMLLVGASGFDCPPDSAYYPELDSTSVSYGDLIATGLCACVDFGSSLTGTDSTVNLAVLLEDNEPLRAFQFEIVDNAGGALEPVSASPGDKIDGWTVPVAGTDVGTTLVLGFSLSGGETAPGVGDTLVEISFAVSGSLPDTLSFFLDGTGGITLSDADAQNVACSYPDSGSPATYPAVWPLAAAEESGLPTTVVLQDNFPNPFNAVTTVRFHLPSDESVEIAVYNIVGQKVATLVNRHLSAGSHVIRWDGRDRWGVAVASGVYLYRMTAGDFSDRKKMALLR